MTQDGDEWQALVNTAMNIRVLIKSGEFINQLKVYYLLINYLPIYLLSYLLNGKESFLRS
jgi:hypothetical protein